MSLAVKTGGNPLALSSALRRAVRESDKDLALFGIAPLTDSVAKSTNSRRFSAVLLAAFALLALVLAAVGIYGVISDSVTRRVQEMGIRMALGADRGRIESMVVGRALALGGAGVALGFVSGLVLTRLLRTLLYGVSATDPAIFVLSSFFLLVVTALAAYGPARRAAHTDPCIALRLE
ncbi:MAG TPA: FtsX-like permease family protein [Bryobacteraceae bacterium]|nr:FtsX-like permease family protein [Bryobacteraceae bacterium]